MIFRITFVQNATKAVMEEAIAQTFNTDEHRYFHLTGERIDGTYRICYYMYASCADHIKGLMGKYMRYVEKIEEVKE